MSEHAEPAMNDAAKVLVRDRDIVWRAGPDRILLQSCTAHRTTSVELHGTAAFVWLALDEPATAAEVVGRLEEAEMHTTGLTEEMVQDAFDELIAAGLAAVSMPRSVPP